MDKLTLSVDQKVASRAKRYAARQGTSVSALVERFLDALSRSVEADDFPELRRLRGCLRGADADAYRKHVLGKYK